VKTKVGAIHEAARSREVPSRIMRDKTLPLPYLLQEQRVSVGVAVEVAIVSVLHKIIVNNILEVQSSNP
jgi:hypothetical protein